VISRKVLFSIILGVAGVLIMTWKIVRIPAHVVIINQSGTTIQKLAIETDSGRIEIGTLQNGESRRFAVNPTSSLRLRLTSGGWTSPEPLTAGQSIVIYFKPEGRVESRNRLGTIVR
jgi:hypothetical protein